MSKLAKTGLMKLLSALAIVLALLGSPAIAQESQPKKSPLTGIVDAWLGSPHANRKSSSFTHWNEDGEIPGSCAVCHSSTGALDYMSGPMQTPGVIDHPVGVGSVVDCATCHSSTAKALTSVPFPSGATFDNLGKAATCNVCHQGRASTNTVDSAVTGLEEDAVAAELTFINIHYAAAGASAQGTAAKGGYEYDGKIYRGEFKHVKDFATCTDCHNPHTLTVSMPSCVACHKDAENFADIRTSTIDFDGDGNVTEGISNPIAFMHQQLEQAISSYASEVVGTAIVYSSSAFPYFFIDGDEDGTASEGEAIYPNRYQTWTPRLLRAAYNYQFIAKDKAIYTHNPHYALQLLYDSMESLSEKVDVELATFVRPQS